MAPTETTPLQDDDSALHRLGIRRRHERRLTGSANFCTGFTCVGVLGGSLSLYGYGMTAGGPALILRAWAVGGALTLLVALALAEVCSALPDAGSLHVFAAKLARRHHRAAAWSVGWLNACGQIALAAVVDFGAAMFLTAFAAVEWGVTTSRGGLYLTFISVLVVHALLVTLSGRERIAALAKFSSGWQVGAAAILVAALAIKPAHLQSPHVVFTSFVNQTGFGAGWSGGSRFYICVIALLTVAFSLAGFDASARVSEETLDASRSAPRAIVASVAAAWLLGFAVLTALTFAIQDYAEESGSPVPAARIMWDAIGRTGAGILLVVVLIAQFLCGLACTESSARVLFAVSRERMLPGSVFWYRVSRRTRTATNAVWLTVAVAALLAVPVLWDANTFAALAAFAAFTSALAVAVPVYLRLRRRDFVRGLWHLGRWSALVGWLAIGWTLLVSAALLAPQASPITVDSFDDAPALVILAVLAARIRWSATARGTDVGPLRRGYPDEPGALDAELT